MECLKAKKKKQNTKSIPKLRKNIRKLLSFFGYLFSFFFTLKNAHIKNNSQKSNGLHLDLWVWETNFGIIFFFIFHFQYQTLLFLFLVLHVNF